jgi:D-psicose/D-tagatose/L-ribulose 3-epimerase
MRKIGIFYAYWTEEWDVDFLPFVERVKRLGFDQLEINAGPMVDMTTEEKTRLRGEADRLGIALSYGIGLTQEHDVSSLDETVRQRGLIYMKKMIEAVGTMGGGMIGGTIHSYWPAALPQGLTDKGPIREQSLKSMKELVKIAEDNRVILNVEVINRFEQFLLNTCEEAVRYVDEVGSPNCAILLDTFHMNIEEDSFRDAILLAGKRLSAFHLGETNRKPPGLGRMPWEEIKGALDDIGFDGPLVMEPFVRPGGTIGRNISVWRDLMPGADLDTLAARAVEFTRKTLC